MWIVAKTNEHAKRLKGVQKTILQLATILHPFVSSTPLSSFLQVHNPNLSIFWANEIGKCLWLFVVVVTVCVCVVVVMSVWVLSWPNILHLVNTAALRAALNRAVLGHLL
jgi:hypothetical protein